MQPPSHILQRQSKLDCKTDNSHQTRKNKARNCPSVQKYLQTKGVSSPPTQGQFTRTCQKAAGHQTTDNIEGQFFFIHEGGGHSHNNKYKHRFHKDGPQNNKYHQKNQQSPYKKARMIKTRSKTSRYFSKPGYSTKHNTTLLGGKTFFKENWFEITKDNNNFQWLYDRI